MPPPRKWYRFDKELSVKQRQKKIADKVKSVRNATAVEKLRQAAAARGRSIVDKLRNRKKG